MEWKFTKDGKIVSLRPVGSMLVDNSDILLSCGLAGLGIIQHLNAPLLHILFRRS